MFWIQEQELRKQAEYDVNLKDKLMVDEIVRKIHEEDQRYWITLWPG